MDSSFIRRRAAQALIASFAAALLAACGGGDGDSGGASGAETAQAPPAESPPAASSPPAADPPAASSPPAADPPAADSPAAQPADFPPVISGKPGTEVPIDQLYAFTPSAADANGDALAFSVVNLPSWAAFDPATGAITGTPRDQHVGDYANVTISVTANGRTASLAPFTIRVVAVGAYRVTLSWLPPTHNEDGSALMDLAGYKIRYGHASGQYTETITVANPGISSYVVENLVKSTYYFVISAYNSSGVESRYSNEAWKAL